MSGRNIIREEAFQTDESSSKRNKKKNKKEMSRSSSVSRVKCQGSLCWEVGAESCNVMCSEPRVCVCVCVCVNFIIAFPSQN